MKKKIMAAILAALLLLCLGIFWKVQKDQKQVINNAKPGLVMIDGIRYGISGYVEQRPDAPPDGTIREVLDNGAFPRADGQANFGSAGMYYWRVDEGIVVEASMYYVLTESN